MDKVKIWAEMTWEEKREERFKKWLNPGVKFPDEDAAALYKERVNRFIQAIKLEEPDDRVPVILPAGNIPAYLENEGRDTQVVQSNNTREQT